MFVPSLLPSSRFSGTAVAARARIWVRPLQAIGQAYFFKHEFEKALSNLLLAIQDHPGYPHPYRFLAACYAHVGRLDEARETVSRLRAITSLVIPDASFLRNPKDREFYLSALRLAAGE